MRGFFQENALALTGLMPEMGSQPLFAASSSNLSIQDVVGTFAPQAIVVGTTGMDSLERALTVYAREQTIPTIGVLDERYGYQRRFVDERGNLSYLPDVIALMDDQCYADAVDEGLPASRLRVTGSPILSFLAYEASAILDGMARLTRRPYPAWKQLVFISETFDRDNGSSPQECGRLGAFLGFTEETVRRDIFTILQEIRQPTVLIERLHPSDDRIPQEGRVGEHLYWKQMRGGDLWLLLRQSDAVIGMRSMALLEATLLGCRVASYQPNLVGENRCAAVHFRVAERLDTLHELKGWLMCTMSATTGSLPPPAELPFIRSDAADQVADLVLRKLGES